MNPEAKKVKCEITTATVARLAWSRGYKGVAGLAKALGRNRVTIWCAVRWPGRYGPTMKMIEEVLCE